MGGLYLPGRHCKECQRLRGLLAFAEEQVRSAEQRAKEAEQALTQLVNAAETGSVFTLFGTPYRLQKELGPQGPAKKVKGT